MVRRSNLTKTSLTLPFITITAFVLTWVMVALPWTVARAQSPYQPGVEFPTIWLAPGERARVSAFNQGTGSSTKDTGCSITLQFLDTGGQAVKQTVGVLKQGEAVSLDLSRSELPGDDSLVAIRAVLLFGYFGGAPPGPGMLERFDCNIAPRLEVYNDHTGKTRLNLSEAEPLAQPAAPAQ